MGLMKIFSRCFFGELILKTQAKAQATDLKRKLKYD
jgi:hypothetical protein